MTAKATRARRATHHLYNRCQPRKGPDVNDGASLSSGIASFSLGITLPQLLTFFVVVVLLFGLTKLSWG